MSSLIQQRREPEFIESAYFFKFRFEAGKYVFVGRERLNDRDVLCIEYYPARLFAVSKGRPQSPSDAAPSPPADRNAMESDAFGQIMNKASLVTLWIDPAANQIVKYTFTTLNIDAMPAAWFARLREFKASMTMGQPFKDAWLPKEVEFRAGALLASGPIDVAYHIEYRNYLEATATAKIKKQ